MNDIGLKQAIGQVTANKSASSQNANIANINETGKELPIGRVSGIPEAAENASQAQASTPQGLDNAVASVNSYVQSVNRDLQFSVDEELERTVIKVVDSGTGELIRQIPEDIFLDLARNLKQDGELQLVDALG